MKDRPRIKPELSLLDKFVEFTGWSLVIATWLLVIINYSELPDTIPTHYNVKGEADNFGGKATLWTLPVISTVLFMGLTLLNRFPHIFNYPTTITEENALRQYTNATRMIRFLKVIVVFIFGLITFRTILIASGQETALGKGFLPLVLIPVFLPLIYFIFKAIKGIS